MKAGIFIAMGALLILFIFSQMIGDSNSNARMARTETNNTLNYVFFVLGGILILIGLLSIKKKK